MGNIFDSMFDDYINMLYATGGHDWTHLNNGTEMYYYKDKVYYEGQSCFKHSENGRLYFVEGNKIVLADKDYKKIGYTLSLNLAVYLLDRADGKVYSIMFDTSDNRNKFVIVTNKGVYDYYDTNNFHSNYSLILYLCKAFKNEMEKYKLKELNP